MSIRLKIASACLMFILIFAGLGRFADRMQAKLGDLAINIYDSAYLGATYIALAQSDYLRFRAFRGDETGAPLDDVSRQRLQRVLDNIDIAMERAMSDRARVLATAARARIAGLADVPDAVDLATIDADLSKVVQRYRMDGLEARDDAEAFVADTQSTLWRTILFAVVLALMVAIALDRAIMPPLKRAVGIARAVAGGKLDNRIVATGQSETAFLLRALAVMQAAIRQSQEKVVALHAAEVLQQKLHEAELRSSLERWRELSDSTFEGLLIHRDGVVLDGNAAFCAMVGLPLDEVRCAAVATFVTSHEWALNIQAEPDTPEMKEIIMTTSRGEALPVEVRTRPITYGGEIARVTALRDIRQRLAAENRILHLAHHDMLTGLANRFLLHDVFTRQLKMPCPQYNSITVLCIDLDRFKAVNDTFGHQAGDMLLAQVADRIRENIRVTDTAARIGGDEFIILQPSRPQPSDAAQLARRLISRLSEPYDVDGQNVCIGASIGIAQQPQDGARIDLLLKNADLALYRAKSLGRGIHCFYEAAMDTLRQEQQELEQDLAQAISEGRLELAFQPLFGVQSLDVIAFEALVRWPHARRGLVEPSVFIPIAEKTGLIVPLGRWVLEMACRAAVGWPTPCRIAVNISPLQFKAGDLAQTVADTLALTGLHPSRLELEVTESVLIGDTDQAIATLTALKHLGVRIVLDDFGTGYSSLSYLRLFSFDKIKIDKSFVRHLANDSGAQMIVRAILALCHQLELKVTAEGVETDEQFTLLRSTGCDEVQGFLLSRPMLAERVESYLIGLAEEHVARLPA